jgi:radical SAM superfamily enzyme YgiQ (UPF0313 family)
MKNVMLIYPPGPAYQRGEDRCQGNIEDSAATTMRACNDLGYVAAGISGKGYRIFLKDYPGEKKKLKHLIRDVTAFSPDLLFMSVTNATIHDDLEILVGVKAMRPKVTVVLKGALFFDAEPGLLKRLDLRNVDYLIGGESDFIGPMLIDAHFNRENLAVIPGIFFRVAGEWEKTDFTSWEEDLDSLPFPDRSLMNNRIYKRPDTGETQATITVGRGCPSGCVYCLTPHISGRKLRQRSPANIVAEIRECYHRYGIRNFFMKSDTFTMDRDWVDSLCTQILHSELAGNISWVANSRTRPLERETLSMMKKAGCWLVAFGFESGSSETMERIKKGATVSDSFRAAKLARDEGLKIFGFFMTGFPWETMDHLERTEDLIFALDSDFIEVHIPVPYDLTELKKISGEEGLNDVDDLGKDYFKSPSAGTRHLTMEEVLRFRRRLLRRYYFRLSYIGKRLYDAMSNPSILIRYAAYALKLSGKVCRLR